MRRKVQAGRRLLSISVATCLTPIMTAAAQAELKGRVLADSAGAPVAEAEVSVVGTALRAFTDSSGRFALATIPSGRQRIVVRAVGWTVDTSVVEFTPALAVFRDFTLSRQAQRLGAVRVAAEAERPVPAKMAGFQDRRRMGIGHFIDRAMLDRYSDRRMSNVLSAVPGVLVRTGRSSKAWLASGRAINLPGGVFSRVSSCTDMLDRADCAAGAKPACYLDVYLDGTLVFDSSGRQLPLFDINSLQPGTIEGIEVYSSASQIPAQYNRSAGGCGVMLIWTRV